MVEVVAQDFVQTGRPTSELSAWLDEQRWDTTVHERRAIREHVVELAPDLDDGPGDDLDDEPVEAFLNAQPPTPQPDLENASTAAPDAPVVHVAELVEEPIEEPEPLDPHIERVAAKILALLDDSVKATPREEYARVASINPGAFCSHRMNRVSCPTCWASDIKAKHQALIEQHRQARA